MTGTAIANEVHAALLEVGQDTGAGELLATFERPGAVDESTYPPTIAAPTTFALRVMQEMIADSDKDGTNVRQGDIMLMVSAVGDGVPDNGDKVSLAGRTYSVEAVDAEAPGGVALYYMVRARGAGPTGDGTFKAAFVPQGATGMVTSDGDTFFARQ